MKSILYTSLLFILLISGCRKDQPISPLLQSVEMLLPVYADSASVLLDSVKTPDELDDEDFARWCMLRGKVTDETTTRLPPIYQWKRAQGWFAKHGTSEEQAQSALYLGRAYAEDGEYDKAMKTYTDALQLAKEHRAYNVAGYICTYMADLYELRDMSDEIRNKYQAAIKYFQKAHNFRSQAYALKNLAIDWAFIDSFAIAMSYLYTADTIAQHVNDKNLSAAVANATGIISSMQGKYNDAERFHLKAIKYQHDETIKDSIALLKVYLNMNQFSRVDSILYKISSYNQFDYTINDIYYMLHKKQGRYKEALHYKEICSDILDSLTIAQNNMKILEIEKKYNNAKVREENERLKTIQQRNFIIIVISFSLLLLSVAGYIIHRQKIRARLYQQQIEVDKIKIEYLHLSIELEEKKQALQTALSEQSQKTEKLQAEIETISLKYQKLQQQQLKSSAIGKKLATLVKKNKLEDKQTISNDKAWKAITLEVDRIYPRFYSLLKDTFHPALTEQEFQYCYLHIFGFDGNEEAKLLGINPDTVRTKRSRINQKRPKQPGEEASLRDFLIKKQLN